MTFSVVRNGPDTFQFERPVAVRNTENRNQNQNKDQSMLDDKISQAPPTAGQVIDLDNVDLTGVDPSRPLIADNTVTNLIIKKMEVVDNNAKTGKNLTIELVTTEPLKRNTGETIPAGFVQFDLVSLVATDKYNPLERLAAIQQAATGEVAGKFTRADYIGKTVAVKIGIEHDAEGKYPDKNRIKQYFKKA